MAYSYIAYPYNHLQKTYIIPFPFLDRTHVHLHIGGVELEEGIHYEWLTDSSIAILKLPEPSDLAGECETDISTLYIKRTTPKDVAVTMFRNGSTLLEEDFNQQTLQLLYITQEAYDSPGTSANDAERAELRQRFLLVSLLPLLIQIQRVLFQIVLLIS